MKTMTKSKKMLIMSAVPFAIFMIFADIVHKRYGMYTNIGASFSLFGILSIIVFLGGALAAIETFCNKVSDAERKQYYSAVLNWFSVDIKWRKGLLGQGVVDAILQSNMSNEHKSRILFGWCMLLIMLSVLLGVVFIQKIFI